MNTHENNIKRLKAILKGFDIPISALMLTGYSQPYCSRAIKGDPKCCSINFIRKVEENLGRIIDKRNVQVFDIPRIAETDLFNATYISMPER